MSIRLPNSLAEKAAQFPEISYGACRATLVLASGELVKDVVLAWGSEIVEAEGKKITSATSLPWLLVDVIDVLPSPLPAA